MDRLIEWLTDSRAGQFAFRFRWLVPVASFALGIGSYFLVQRQNSLAQWLTVLMLLGWVLLLFEGVLCRVLARLMGERMPQMLLRYAVQGLHQETLFFVLPFFLTTTTWLSPQLIFTGLLFVAAAASVIDPIYNEVIGQRRWLFFAFHALALFSALLAAGPIIGSLTTGRSIAIASGVTAVCAVPSFADVIRVRHWSRLFVLMALSLALGGGAWMARFWIPPATLDARNLIITTRVDRAQREPGEQRSHLSVEDIRADGLYAFSAIRAPRGLHQKVLHVWSHDGKVLDRIPLDLEGGRQAGYRAWSHITHFGPHPAGKWRLRVLTDDGQLIGVRHFTIGQGGR